MQIHLKEELCSISKSIVIKPRKMRTFGIAWQVWVVSARVLLSVVAFLYYGTPSQRTEVFSTEVRVLLYFWFQICHTDGTQTMDGFCSRSKHSSSTSVSLSICTHPPMHILLHSLWVVPPYQTFWGPQLSHFHSIQIKALQLNQLTAFYRFS